MMVIFVLDCAKSMYNNILMYQNFKILSDCTLC